MKLHVFICASPLYPHDQQRDEALHVWYLDQHLAHFPESWVRFSVLQNGCVFPYRQINRFCNPFPKSLAYNWLFCDANCEGDYWLFLPEDCRIAEQGWAAIRLYMEQGKDCFALSRDPKAFVCRPGIFRTISSDLHMVCDINVLGKEISTVFLRGELERKGFHCISKNWQKISEEPRRWGNELYQEMNTKDHPEINKALGLPIFQDDGIDGWNASREVLEAAFIKITEKNFDRQRQVAEQMKGVVSHHGPLIAQLPYRGPLGDLGSRVVDFLRGTKPH